MSPQPDDAIETLLQEQFPALRNSVYLNHAAVSPWPRRTAEAVQAFAAENLEQGPANYRDWIARERKLREQLAALLNAPSIADIALVKNTTEGICLVAFGLDWRRGDNIVLPDSEFSSNRLPWEAQARAGVELRRVDIRSPANAEAALIGAIDRNTRLLAVSGVQSNDGFRLNLTALGHACRERGVLFFVDAIQQLGALPIDVTLSRIDFLAADAHKWMMGPESIAVFYSTEAGRPQLRLQQVGWHMFDYPWSYERSDWRPAASARRFEAGSPNSLGQAALSASLGLIEEVGMELIGRRVLRNTGQLLEILGSLNGIRLISSQRQEHRSGIVTFAPVLLAAAEVHRALLRGGVECALRSGAIRLSPHFYQGEKELNQFAECLAGILRS